MTFHSRRIPDQERLKWQDPQAILDEVGLKPGETFIDLGCGDGFFAIPAARRVGEAGLVYGLDISNDAIERLKEKAADEGLKNLLLRVGRAEDTVLCPGCAEVVFFGIVLHDFEDPQRVLLNAGKMLKPSGRLVRPGRPLRTPWRWPGRTGSSGNASGGCRSWWFSWWFWSCWGA